MFGRMLKVNLTIGEISKEQIPAQWAADFIGGSGLGCPSIVGPYRSEARCP